MPLLTSPIDGSPMKEIERYGIKLDLCPTSGGIWFDKGEVEKLIHYVREETLKEAQEDQGHGAASSDSMAPQQSRQQSAAPMHKKRKRENPLAELFEMFEF